MMNYSELLSNNCHSIVFIIVYCDIEEQKKKEKYVKYVASLWSALDRNHMSYLSAYLLTMAISNTYVEIGTLYKESRYMQYLLFISNDG